MTSVLEDEIISINSIYGDGTLVRISEARQICTLRLPSVDSIVLRVEFPEDYPEAPPSIVGTESVGVDKPKGIGRTVVGLALASLAKVFQPGEPCLYDVLQEMDDAIQAEGLIEAEDDQTEQSCSEASLRKELPPLGPEPPWVIANAITEKKSVFVGRAARVSSPAEAKQYIQHLLATDRKVAKATHNITAWRIRGLDGTSFQDCDDDGETAAGGRILHLMQLMDVWNVMVVVTRWYGGVLLGPDRFRIINNAARDALTAAGLGKVAEKTKKK
jgi:hypothetical protein